MGKSFWARRAGAAMAHNERRMRGERVGIGFGKEEWRGSCFDECPPGPFNGDDDSIYLNGFDSRGSYRRSLKYRIFAQ